MITILSYQIMNGGVEKGNPWETGGAEVLEMEGTSLLLEDIDTGVQVGIKVKPVIYNNLEVGRRIEIEKREIKEDGRDKIQYRVKTKEYNKMNGLEKNQSELGPKERVYAQVVSKEQNEGAINQRYKIYYKYADNPYTNTEVVSEEYYNSIEEGEIIQVNQQTYILKSGEIVYEYTIEE